MSLLHIHKHWLFNKALRIMLITNALILISGTMLNPIYAIFVEKVGGDLLDAGFASGVYAFVASITVYLLGKKSDKVKQRELVVVVGYLIIAAGFFGYVFVKDVWSLLIIQAIIGFGEAVYSPSWDAIYSEHLSIHKEGTQWGAWEAMNYMTISLGAVIGALIANTFGFPTLFIIMGSLSLLSALYIYSLPRKVL